MSNKITESDSHYNALEQMSTLDLLVNINREDKTVPDAIEKVLPQIGALADAVYAKLESGGRLFYIGAGTSGRLGIVDASECPPTFGIDQGVVIGIIAGGDAAIRKAVEFAEDDIHGAWRDLSEYAITVHDIVIGIAASGSTPYVVGGLKACRENGIATGSISCNPNAPIAEVSDFPVAVIVGPEFVTGSTRMKAGTAQKLVLNMITTSVMIKLGRVVGNKMVDMQLSNHKLINRGTQMIMNALNIDRIKAKSLLDQFGSVRNAIANYKA
ncbi:MAG: N-acetylmuramic acid 6-phosphate etherase [Bacteroidetes bacterium]|nr:N-acetylmuramic acid 6-phosphate etherase [Bacteroidota bacterium]